MFAYNFLKISIIFLQLLYSFIVFTYIEVPCHDALDAIFRIKVGTFILEIETDERRKGLFSFSNQ